jgi:hypothetical protein
MPWDRVEVIWGDTSKHVPWSCMSVGSQTTHAMTRANMAGASDARLKLQQIAAHVMLLGQDETIEGARRRLSAAEYLDTVHACQELGIDNFQLSFQQADLQWDGAPGASWDTASANWKNSSAAHVAWSDGMPNNASFIDGGANVTTVVTLSSPRRAGRLTFDGGSKSYTLSGSSLELPARKIGAA